MRTKKSIKNIFYNLVQQIVGIITSFIIPPLIIAKFGSALNGLVSTVKDLMRYVALTGAGISATSTYALYEPVAKDDKKQINGIYNATGKLFTKAGNIFSFIALIVACIYPLFIKGENFFLVAILIIVMAISGMSEFYVIGKYQALLSAYQHNYVIAIAQSIGNICNILMTYFLIKLKLNIILVELGASIIYVTRILILTFYVHKNYPYLIKNVNPLFNKITQRKDAIIHEITALVVNNSSIVLVSIFLSLTASSILSIYLLVFSGLNVICSIVSNAIYTSFGDVISKNEQQVLQKAYDIYEWIYVIGITIIYCVAFIMIMPFINVYTKNMTDANYYLPIIGMLFATVGLINNLKIPARTLVVSAGHFKETKNYSIIEMLINIIFQVIFINCLGLVGVLIGCLCSNIYRTINFIWYSNKEILHIDNKRSIKRVFSSITFSFMVIIIARKLIFYRLTSYWAWLKYSFILTIIISLVFLALNWIIEKKTFKEALNVFKQISKKR